jgi:hypothetical protein
MILNRYRKPFDSRIERGSFGHCPGLQYAANLKPEIVMKISPLMLLDHKEQASPVRLATAIRGLPLQGYFNLLRC